MATTSRVMIYTFMIGMLIFGTLNTVIMKLTDETEADGDKFNHPFFQCAVMFLGESLCLLFFLGVRKAYLAEQNESLMTGPAVPPLVRRFGKGLFVIPAFFDLCGSSLMFVGLALTAPSIYQMVRGFIIVVVAVYSIIFLKKTLFRHQWLGVILTILGVAAVGVVSVFYQAKSARNPALGIVFLLAGQLFAGGMFVIEEKLLAHVVIHPLQVVGIEGVAGFCYFLVLLPIFNLIPCDDEDMCNAGYIDNSVHAFEQFQEWLIPLLLVGTMLSIALFNWTGVSTTKYASALARSIVDTSRTVLVWGISLALQWEDFLWQQLIGFLVLVIGSLIYNEILVVPCFGMKESVEKSKAMKKEQPEDVKEDTRLKEDID